MVARRNHYSFVALIIFFLFTLGCSSGPISYAQLKPGRYLRITKEPSAGSLYLVNPDDFMLKPNIVVEVLDEKKDFPYYKNLDKAEAQKVVQSYKERYGARYVDYLPEGYPDRTNHDIIKVRTRSGKTGWDTADNFIFLTRDQAKELYHAERSELRSKIIQVIDRAVSKKARKFHILTRAESIHYTTALESIQEDFYSIKVTVILVGALIGLNKYSLDMNVEVSIFIDVDNLPYSTIEVKKITLLNDKQFDGVHVTEVANIMVNLLAKFAFGI